MSALRHLDAIVAREHREAFRTEAFVACLLFAIAVLAAVFAQEPAAAITTATARIQRGPEQT